jgi:hypothetical protein
VARWTETNATPSSIAGVRDSCPPVLTVNLLARAGAFAGMRVFSVGLNPGRPGPKDGCAQSVATVNLPAADWPLTLALATVIWCSPGLADAGAAIVSGPKVPVLVVLAFATTAGPKAIVSASDFA